MAEIIHMGGYGNYVWSAFGLTFVVLLATVWLTKRSQQQTRDRLVRQLRSASVTEASS